MSSVHPDKKREYERRAKDKRDRKERNLIRYGIIKHEKTYYLNRKKDPTNYVGKWVCLCKYGIPGQEIPIRIPSPHCPAHKGK